MKTRGIKSRIANLKDYEVTHNGVTHLCERYSSTGRFEWRGHKGTLKELKQMIRDWEKVAVEEEEEDVDHGGIIATWMTDAAALLAIMYTDNPTQSLYAGIWKEDIFHALDCYGYINENGDIDIDAARRSYKNIYGRTQ